ncbi:MAG: lysine--tRNA ligase [Planctomycetes bacterium]|nr:lysine--tRNA ligase [Planctomycetota bacterium]
MSERDDRLQHLEALRRLDVEPFGNRFDGASSIGSVVAGYGSETEGKTATVAGRITAHRSFGKAAFLDLRDWTGKVQVYVKKDAVGEAVHAWFQHVGIGDVLAATGTLGKTKTGEITLFATSLTLLTKALRPLPEKWHGLKDPEIRTRRRYLDLIANPEVQQKFLKRARALMGIRRFLDARGYVEVETPMMQAVAGGAAARPFITHHHALDRDLYLRIALEIPLKKLMVGGLERVYEIGRVFRNEGIDTQHNPEFTMLELYHAYGDLRTMMDLVEALVANVAQEITGTAKLPFGERTVDVTPPWPRRDYFELIKTHADLDPSDEDALRAKLQDRRVETAGLTRIDLLDKVFGEYVEPHLVDATYVCNQPLEMTPLCREHRERPGLADRFEAYAGCMEIANAYTELNDPLEQRKRLVRQMKAAGDEMVREGRIDEDFLTALEHGMPPAGGLGIGIDRLLMIVTNSASIREVILFPMLRDES